MRKSRKKNEIKMNQALDALRNLAPTKKFANKTVDDLAVQVEKSMAPRRRLRDLRVDEIEQQALRDTEDINTLKMIRQMVDAILADDEYGPDSPLYEAFGFVRLSERRSGLTRKHHEDEHGTP